MSSIFDFLLPEYSEFGLKATEPRIGRYEERARPLFEALGRRSGEKGMRDGKLRKRLLANLRKTVRELEVDDLTGV